jgi:hypothetical protein
MEYKIVKGNTIDFCEAIGLNPTRQRELSAKLDAMVKSWSPSTGTVSVKVVDIMEEIASYCKNIEEFSYCVMLHMGWHQRRGMLLTPNA